MDAAFELVAPALRRVARAEGVTLREFFRDDPVWRLDFARQAGGEAVVDVAWQEDRPEEYRVSASWWLDDYDTTLRRSHQEEVGTFTRGPLAGRAGGPAARRAAPDRRLDGRRPRPAVRAVSRLAAGTRAGTSVYRTRLPRR